jgi:hypothetical protein
MIQSDKLSTRSIKYDVLDYIVSIGEVTEDDVLKNVSEYFGANILELLHSENRLIKNGENYSVTFNGLMYYLKAELNA